MRARLGLPGGQLVANPIPAEAEIPAAALRPHIDAALAAAEAAGRRRQGGHALPARPHRRRHRRRRAGRQHRARRGRTPASPPEIASRAGASCRRGGDPLDSSRHPRTPSQWPADPSDAAAPPKPPLLQRLRGDFLTGLVIVLPTFLTIYVVWGLVGLVDARVIPLIPRQYNPENVFGRNIFGLGLLVFIIFTTLVGALTKGYIGGRILQVRRKPRRAHADHPLDLQRPEADRRDRVQPVGHRVPAGLPDRVPAQGPLGGRLRRRRHPRRDHRASPASRTCSACSCRRLRTRPPASCCSCRAATSIMLDMTVEEAAKLIISGGMVNPANAQVAPTPARPGAAPAGAVAARQAR